MFSIRSIAEMFLSTGVSFATVIEAERAADPARWHKRGAQLPGMLWFTLVTKGHASRLGVRGRRFVATEYLLTTKIFLNRMGFGRVKIT